MDSNTKNFNEALATGKIVTHPELSYCLQIPASEPSRVGLDVARCQGADGHQFSQRIHRCHWTYDTGRSASWRINPFDSKSIWMDMLTKRYLFLALIALGFLFPASAQVINCPSGFASSGSCGVSFIGSGGQAFAVVGSPNGSNPALSGSQVDLIPTGAPHAALGFIYQTKVNTQAFTSTFTFVPNGWNLAFVIQNNTAAGGGSGPNFSSGAGCEAGFYQAFGNPPAPPNNIFALELDSYSPLTESGSFTYSSAQIYQAGQSPCLPNDNGPNYYPTNKISTSPVNLTTGSQGITTGDVYSATVTYDGTNLTLNMYDVTLGGSCPGASCFTYVWTVDIPTLVDGTTAYVGFTGGTNQASSSPLYVDSFSYTEGSPPPPATSAQATAPTFSPAAGTYSGAQSVTISDATSGATIYYTTNGTTPTTSSTQYTGPITVGSTETLEAIAVITGDANSAVTSGTYTIGSPSPDPPGNAAVINYPSGFAGNPSQLWLGNGSIYSGSSIELTKSSVNLANNAWYKTPVNVQAFTTTFTWTASCPASPAQCGDGMGFMIISNSNPSSAGFNYSGVSGSQLAWSRCYNSTDCPSINSILVKFDLYNESTGTVGANLTGFYSGGVYPQPPQPEYDMAPSGINIESGHLMKATLTYNGAVLMETVTDTVTGATYRNSYSANIPALVGGNTALVGFGGSTGGATVTQNIQSWTYTVESPGNYGTKQLGRPVFLLRYR